MRFILPHTAEISSENSKTKEILEVLEKVAVLTQGAKILEKYW